MADGKKSLQPYLCYPSYQEASRLGNTMQETQTLREGGQGDSTKTTIRYSYGERVSLLTVKPCMDKSSEWFFEKEPYPKLNVHKILGSSQILGVFDARVKNIILGVCRNLWLSGLYPQA